MSDQEINNASNSLEAQTEDVQRKLEYLINNMSEEAQIAFIVKHWRLYYIIQKPSQALQDAYNMIQKL